MMQVAIAMIRKIFVIILFYLAGSALCISRTEFYTSGLDTTENNVRLGNGDDVSYVVDISAGSYFFYGQRIHKVAVSYLFTKFTT